MRHQAAVPVPAFSMDLEEDKGLVLLRLILFYLYRTHIPIVFFEERNKIFATKESFRCKSYTKMI
ncbi:hypothetical protein Calhy_0404 [Caldicellulosiruptor hydrothermalis 108]|uniref:Uncharacterized protein n=1 Tax=Caldicellulosiruptor hydrothermalis (strain DSM 18901 / VKM B-2411 / 108) TaxID=632292 RepID=E4QBX8_CALH1|nr:hypothetical protein Calhy_0404 [Caldicellulosiruptor hydrothermalis 108]